ncbi:hypothetical protein ES702_07430 [subsurface metagenome]
MTYYLSINLQQNEILVQARLEGEQGLIGDYNDIVTSEDTLDGVSYKELIKHGDGRITIENSKIN